MAIGGSVWGIDIGQCGLKALRGKMTSDGTSVIAESFEYIEYPKILSQPDADPDELVREALKQFLSRNVLRGDKVCISVAGQSGLARFIDLPPVEPKKLPELVGFEAKQQIPFALEDVVWDYQKMPDVLASDDDEDDFPAENVVGLFAMKRDQVLRLIQPMVDAEIELDVIQLTPIAIYNAIAFDQFPLGSEEVEVDPNHWTVVLSLGTDASDLVLTNGYRVWQRSIPIGGSHFTKQLTSELKLTFAKAEHIKRNAREAEDAKEVFRAMRPTFNDLVTEVQRTLGYFESLDRDAELVRTIVLGNAAKLPGLTQYLEKNLGRKITRLDDFARMSGPSVVDEPLFKENTLAFPVCYGLMLQGLNRSKLKTNLIPKEILRQRLIRSKKPWFVAIAASLLLSMAFNYFFNWRAWDSVHDERKTNNVSWKQTRSKVEQLKNEVNGYKSEDSGLEEELKRLNGVGEEAVGSADGRVLWLELTKAITAALPGEENFDDIPPLSVKGLLERDDIYIQRIESEFFPDLAEWFSGVQELYNEQQQIRNDALAARAQEAQAQAAAEGDDAAGDANAGDPPVPPADSPPAAAGQSGAPDVTGSGWVIELEGFHFQHNDGNPGDGAEYVRRYLLEPLEYGSLRLPIAAGGELVDFKMQEMGILAPVELSGRLDSDFEVPDPDAKVEQNPRSGMGGFEFRGPQQQNRRSTATVNAAAYRFTVQFCWKQITARQRLELRQEQQRAAEGNL